MDLRSPEVLKSFSGGKVPTSMAPPLKRFYKGEPMALGITQILFGILGIVFVLVIDMVDDHRFHDIHLKIPYWTGIWYIISGSLSVAAARNPRMPLVKGALGMNVVSTVAAGIAMVASSISMCFQRPTGRDYSPCDYQHNDTETVHNCHKEYTVPYATMYNTVSFLLTLTVLQFLIALVSAAFGCASVCRNSYSETTIVIFQNTPEPSKEDCAAPPVP